MTKIIIKYNNSFYIFKDKYVSFVVINSIRSLEKDTFHKKILSASNGCAPQYFLLPK